MKKLGCAKCGGAMKMKLGGSAVAKAPVNIFGIPQENMGTSSQMGFGRKGGSVKKEHVLTTFRKANDARNARVMKSLPKAEDGMSTGYPRKPASKGPIIIPSSTLTKKDAYISRNKPITNGPIAKRSSSKFIPTQNVSKPIKSDNSRVKAGVSAKTPTAPKSTEPVRKPSIEFGDPNVGFKYNKPQPKTKYEDAVINTKSPSTNTSGYTPKRGATASLVTTRGPITKGVARPTPKRIPEELKKKINMKKDMVNADKVGIAGPVGYAISNMFKKKGGATKSKKK